MSALSGKWAIFEAAPGLYRIEFYDPSGKIVTARCTFDRPAIEEFAKRLNDVVNPS